MKKLSIKELVDFRRKSDRGKKNFVENMKSNKIVVPTEGGGDYWITGLSAICNSYKQNDVSVIDDKIGEVRDKLNDTSYTITRNMYQRNIDMLQKYKNMDVKKLRATEKQLYLKKSSGNPLLTIKGLQLEAKPSLIYTFGKNNENVGAIWFVAKVNGYRIEEVSMFCEMLQRFLRQNYSKKYQLNSKFCLAADMISGQVVDYAAIESGKLPQVLSLTLDEINKLM